MYFCFILEAIKHFKTFDICVHPGRLQRGGGLVICGYLQTMVWGKGPYGRSQASTFVLF